MNYYNENDSFAAAWLRELIKAGHISQGEVDERSIKVVQPADLKGFTQCHFFAGIGVWSYALRQAGWPDDRPVWTGSCPCQPFSAAGKKGGFDDTRHLWPDWFRLIKESKPDTVFGEQVASKDGLAWLDLVSTDLEGADYAVGAADLCAAGFGAPHIRQRFYFVGTLDNATNTRRDDSGKYGSRPPLFSSRSKQPSPIIIVGHSDDTRSQRRGMQETITGRNGSSEFITGASSASITAADSSSERRQQISGSASSNEETHGRTRRDEKQPHSDNIPTSDSQIDDLADTGSKGWQQERTNTRRRGERSETKGLEQRPMHGGAVNGFWSNAEWIPCIDGKARPVEPGTFPLAHGVAQRVGRLRGYGNALCAEVAKGFIQAYLEIQK